MKLIAVVSLIFVVSLFLGEFLVLFLSPLITTEVSE